MAAEFSQTQLKNHCPFCKPDTFSDILLLATDNFRLVVDHYALTAGHLLLMPKDHLSCAGAYPEKIWQEFLRLYGTAKQFLKRNFGNTCSFEHGNIGQSVYHSHIHFLPCQFSIEDIVPEGERFYTSLQGLGDLRKIYRRSGGYLFLQIGEKLWTVDTSLSSEGFFVTRLAPLMGVPKRGNWKVMDKDEKEMAAAADEVAETIRLWKIFSAENGLA